MRHLSLPVRHRRRDAVGIQANAAHAERCSRAEAADRELHILCEVLAIPRTHPSDPTEVLRQSQVESAPFFDLDGGDRSGHLEGLHSFKACGDNNSIQRLRLIPRLDSILRRHRRRQRKE